MGRRKKAQKEATEEHESSDMGRRKRKRKQQKEVPEEQEQEPDVGDSEKSLYEVCTPLSTTVGLGLGHTHTI